MVGLFRRRGRVLAALGFALGLHIAAPPPAEAAWGGWESLGGVILEDQSCTSWSADRIDCFARGTDAAMWHRWWDGSRWGGWESLGGVILESPDCVSWGPNRIDCFARGTDQAMWHRWWDGARWGGWDNLGGVIQDKPECISWGPNRLDCFGRGLDGAMHHRWWDGSRWGGWENLGGVILEAPECVAWGSNRIDCFARGTDAAMHHRWWDGTRWGGWESLGGVILEKPECVAWGANRLDCFARGTDRAMYHRWWDGARWGGWESLGGIILEEPECVAWGPNRLDCFARGTDLALHHRWWDGNAWGGWESLGGVILEKPECTSWAANRLDCFVRGTDRAMWHRWWTPGAPIPFQRLSIRRHNTLTFTDAQADQVLADATTVLRTNDGPGDVACNTGMARNGAVGAFTETDGNLNTNAEVQQVFGLAGNIKVVPTVDFCGATGFNTSIIGCGQTPGASFITERFTPAAQEGILWAHEFGHNRGLNHRNDTSDAIMFPSIGPNRQRINPGECGSYGGSAALLVEANMAETDPNAPLPPVEEFVRQIWFEGLSLDQAARYTPADAQKLVAMLNDPAEVLYHENIANVIGMIGDPATTDDLIAYVERGPATVGPAPDVPADQAAAMAEKGRVAALVGLGYIAARSGDQAAVDYLIGSTQSRVWEGRGMRPSAQGPAPDVAKLREYAVFGLGLSAQPRAIDHLRLMNGGRLRSTGMAGVSLSDEVTTALAIAKEVSDRGGLIRYYERR